MDGKKKNRSHISLSFITKRPLILTFAILVIISLLLWLAVAIINSVTVSKTEETDISQRNDLSKIPEIPNPTFNSSEYIDVSVFAADPLSYIRENENFSRTVRIVQVFNGESSGFRTTVSCSSGCLKAESNSHVIIYNDKKIYEEYGSQNLKYDADVSEFYRKTGITSLDMIREMCKDTQAFESTLSLSDDQLVLTADITEKEAGIRMLFEINVESGLVLAERFYYDENPYRYVITEILNTDFRAESDFFEIP